MQTPVTSQVYLALYSLERGRLEIECLGRTKVWVLVKKDTLAYSYTHTHTLTYKHTSTFTYMHIYTDLTIILIHIYSQT